MIPQRTRGKALSISKEFSHKEITKKIISCAMKVHSTLGPGLLEYLYEQAMEYEFIARNIKYERQKKIKIKYEQNCIGFGRLDYLVEDKIVLELKCVDAISNIH